MNTTISPQIRILAVVGLLAAVGLGASLLVFGHGSAKTAGRAATTHATVRSSKPVTPAHTTPRTHSTPAKATAAAKHTAKTHVASRTQATKTKPAGFRGNRVYANLPRPLQWELAHHKVVVVSLYNPSSDVDAISVAEAHAGAIDAGAGFLLVSVLDNKVAGILTALLPGGGLLPDPGVLVYRAPGDIAIRLDGFADRASVAQAATNVISGQAGPAVSAAAAPATTGTP
jgi:hypothetical protein